MIFSKMKKKTIFLTMSLKYTVHFLSDTQKKVFLSFLTISLKKLSPLFNNVETLFKFLTLSVKKQTRPGKR